MQTQINQDGGPPIIVDSLSRSFSQKQNTLLLHSKGIDIVPSLSRSLYFQKLHLTILIDFDQVDIREINYYFKQIKQQKLILRDDVRSDLPQVHDLTKVIREKRRKLYVSGGIYSITLQIMLLDCLSEGCDLNPGLIDRIIIRNVENHLEDKYSLRAWMATLVSLKGNSTIITGISSKAVEFRGQKLQKIVRLLYIKKVVLWPFGRSQIHKSLKKNSLKNRNHKLSLNQLESSIHKGFMQLQKYCQKSAYDKAQLNYLMLCLLNFSRLDYIMKLEQMIKNSGQYSIWRSNNTNVIELIEKIIKMSRRLLFNYTLIDQKEDKLNKQQGYKHLKLESDLANSINLRSLIKEQQKNQDSTNIKNAVIYTVNYQLSVRGLKRSEQEKEEEYDEAFLATKAIQLIKSVKQIGKVRKRIEKMEQIQVVSRENLLVVRKVEDQTIQQETREKPKQNENEKGTRDRKEVAQRETIEQQQIELNHEAKVSEEDQKKLDFTLYEYRTKKQDINKCRNKSEQSRNISKQIQANQQEKKVNKEFAEPKEGYLVYQQAQYSVYVWTNLKQLNKHLHYSIFCYQNKCLYIAYLRKMQMYLETKLDERDQLIKKIMKKKGSKNNTHKFSFVDQEPILLQEFYLQLKQVNLIIDRFSAIKDDYLQRDSLFRSQIEKQNFRYFDKSKLSLWPKDYNPFDDCFVSCLYDGPQMKCKVRFCFHTNNNFSELNQYLRVLVPHSIYFFSPNTSFIRHLNICYSQQLLLGVELLHTFYFHDSLQSETVIKGVKQEDQAFWGISEQRKKLAQYIQNPDIRVSELIIDDDIHKKAKMIQMASMNQLKHPKGEFYNIEKPLSMFILRTILIDKRQFKSLLPSYLFHHGFRIIPVFLQSADYILSNEIGIQKKSVHTRDLHESLKSGRLFQQIKRLCIKFPKPYLLIQCPDISFFKRDQFIYAENKVTGGKYQFNVRKQLINLVQKFPKINIIWSTSYADTVKYLIELKKNQQEPQIGKFKPQSQENELQILEQKDDEQNELLS